VGLTLSQPARALVAQPVVAIIGTKRADGSVQMNPAWFEYRDGYLWLNSHTGRAWPQNVIRDRTVSVLVVDPKDAFRWVRIDGRLVEATTEGAEQHINRLAKRYTGKSFRALEPDEQRITLRIDPVRVSGEEI
jgi:PPOX class probable F420-dependent enzyme